MGKKEQILVLDPASELHFVGPFTEVVTSTLRLTNPSDSPVIFKLKTTASEKYCVRRNSGILMPDEVVNIAVMLQPFDYNPNEKIKHRFMVQTMAVKNDPDVADMGSEELWRDAQPENIMDSKLRCVFYLPENPKHEIIDLDSVNNRDNIFELSTMELKVLLTRNFISFRGCCEKSELQEKVCWLWDIKESSQNKVSIPDENLCKICMDSNIDSLFLDCGHMVTCSKCGKLLHDCPICRQIIKRVVRVFKS